MKKLLWFAVSTAVLFICFLGLYYQFRLLPKMKIDGEKKETIQVIYSHLDLLKENRLALVTLIKLDSEETFFLARKSELVATLKKSNAAGVEKSTQERYEPALPELKKRFPELISEQLLFYQKQDALLARVFATESFKDGVAILKSPESVELLTTQTNLILEYEYWLTQLE